MNSPQPRRRFNTRAFVSIAMACAAIGLPWTGLANHLLQQEAMSVQRHAWMAAHNSLGILFVLFAVWHVVLNRRALANYFRTAAARAAVARLEAACAIAIVTLATAFVLSHAFHVQ